MPIVGIVRIELAALLENILQAAAPPMASIVFVQAVENSAIGGALHGDIQRRINAQPLLVHGCGAVSLLEILPDVFDEVRRQIVVRRRKMKRERRERGRFRIRGTNLALVRHQREHQISPRARPLPVKHGRIRRAANDTRK